MIRLVLVNDEPMVLAHLRTILESAEDRQPVDAGHPQVHQHHVRPVAHHGFHRLGPVLRPNPRRWSR